MKPIFIPDYRNTVMNVSCSILRHYGFYPKHEGIPAVDQSLAKNFRNIVLILVDALGKSIMDKYPAIVANLEKDYRQTISSVFPPTTVAATTSVLTGEPPLTTGWLGWTQYIKDEEKSVVLFTNKDYYDDAKVFDYSVADKYVPVEKIYDKIKHAAPDVETKEIFPKFREPEHDTFQKQCQTIVKTVNEPGRHFVYAYWDKLDTDLHSEGPDGETIGNTLKEIDSAYCYLTEAIPKDTVVILIADHSQIEVKPLEIRKYEDLWDTLVHEPSIESRAAAFFVKEDKKELFEQLFVKYFNEHFILYKTEDVLAMNLFGFGEEHPLLRGFLGDYLAIAIGNYNFQFRDSGFVMKGQHAGFLAEETLVPLIIHEKK